MSFSIEKSKSFLICVILCNVFFVSAKAQQPGIHFDEDYDKNFQVYIGANNSCDKAREYKHKADERTVQYERNLEEYKNGLFCNQCWKTKSQLDKIYANNGGFEKHIVDGKASGREKVAPTKEMYDKLYREYRSDFDPLKKSYEDAIKECTGNRVKLTSDVNTAVSNYNGYYTTVYQNLNKVKDVVQRNNLQTRLANNNKLKEQYKSQAQQQLNNRDLDGMSNSLAKIEKLKSELADIDNNINVAINANATNKSNGVSTSNTHIANASNSHTTVQSVAVTNSSNFSIGSSSYTASQSQANNNYARKQQLAMLEAAKQKQEQASQQFSDALNNLADMITNNMIQKSIREEDAKRNQEFADLNDKVNKKNGELIDCNRCNGNGYNTCSYCKGGQVSCTLCWGLGKNISGATCTGCKGTGKSICFQCNGSGNRFCVYCSGTGKDFKENYGTFNNNVNTQQQYTETSSDDNRAKFFMFSEAKGGKSYFKKISNDKWIECERSSNKVLFNFSVIEEGEQNAILFDESRNMYVKLTQTEAFWGYSKDKITYKILDGYWLY